MIKYPTTKKRYQRPRIGKQNRGMALEKLIDASNQHYRESGRAVIHKKPTPVQIVNVDYPERARAKITEAYYRRPSTTDYNGIYKGRYIDFDVKETHHETSYALKNIHQHQIEHLRSVHRHGGIAFLLIRVAAEDAIFLLPFETLEKFLERAKTGRKSMTLEEIAANGYIVRETLAPRIDYLEAVDRYIKGQA